MGLRSLYSVQGSQVMLCGPSSASFEAEDGCYETDRTSTATWVCNTGTNRKHPREQWPSGRNWVATGRTVRCASMEPANPENRITTHAPPRKTSNNHAKRTAPLCPQVNRAVPKRRAKPSLAPLCAQPRTEKTAHRPPPFDSTSSWIKDDVVQHNSSRDTSKASY
jgi:hypothetical protein